MEGSAQQAAGQGFLHEGPETEAATQMAAPNAQIERIEVGLMAFPNILELAIEINETAHDKGWYDKGERNFGEVIALMHSELSEALESWRKDEPGQWVGDGGKPEGWATELADCLIRILDTLLENGFNPYLVTRDKMDYNKTRPYRHGGKKA
jgi:hypothetical protein